MSIEYCDSCGNNIDTDFNVEGIYDAGEYICDICAEDRYEGRMKDTNGWFTESLVEHDDEVMEKLSQLIMDEDAPEVGKYVINMVEKYMGRNGDE